LAPSITTRVPMPPSWPWEATASIWAAAEPNGASTDAAAMSLSLSGLAPSRSSCGGWLAILARARAVVEDRHHAHPTR